MEWLGRYSMTDVMVLALMIFYVNSSGYTEATVHAGRLLLCRERADDHARLRLGQHQSANSRPQATTPAISGPRLSLPTMLRRLPPRPPLTS